MRLLEDDGRGSLAVRARQMTHKSWGRIGIAFATALVLTGAVTLLSGLTALPASAQFEAGKLHPTITGGVIPGNGLHDDLEDSSGAFRADSLLP